MNTNFANIILLLQGLVKIFTFFLGGVFLSFFFSIFFFLKSSNNLKENIGCANIKA